MGGSVGTPTSWPDDSTWSGRSTVRLRSDTLSCESSIVVSMSSISGFLMLALLLDGGATDASTELVRRRFQKWEELRLVDALVVRVLGADALGVQVVHDRVVERLHA